MSNQSESGGGANDLHPIDLDFAALRNSDFESFCRALFEWSKKRKTASLSFYDKIRKDHAWVNKYRPMLALLGGAAILLTSVATMLQFFNPDGKSYYGIAALVIAVVLYALIGALSFYERNTDASGTYFRSIDFIFAVHDLWTKLQFELLRALETAKDKDPEKENTARDKMIALVQGFASDLDKLKTTNIGAWRVQFATSLSALDLAAKKGNEDAQKLLGGSLASIRKAATDLAKVSEEAARPTFVSLKFQGDCDGDITIYVDGSQVAETHLKEFVIDRIRPGLRKIEARAEKGDRQLHAIAILETKPGLQNLSLTLA